MKRTIFTFLISVFLYISSSYGQLGIGIFGLTKEDAQSYSKPLATFLGTYFNSSTYYTAEIPDMFRFKFSIVGMYSMVSDDQKTFTPSPIDGYEFEPTATFFGEKGGAFLGPDGYRVYPAGFNVGSIPSGIYQVAGSFYGTELMVRLFPSSTFSEIKTGFWGIGISHSINRWIPTLPLDFAVQILYNKFDLEYVGKDANKYLNFGSKNFAINVHASKTLGGLFIVYGGMQYESSTMDLEYFFRDPNELYPEIKDTRQKTSVDGDNAFRLTAGGAVKLAVIVFNIDMNVTSMFTVAGGVSLQF
ncbi:hypothetical protein LJE86_09325 [bacterium BMS3Abin03]|nr:hypothetical protein [bacterium BMS3Abin03]MCG6961032.1 hypothetical protein [bacterium BMS3Abin03]